MNTKEYLGQIKNIDRRIQDKIDEAQKWREIALGAKMGGDNADRVQTSKKYDKLGDAVATYVDYEAESYAIARRMAILKYDITKQIDDMPNEMHYVILKDFYIKGKSARDLMEELHYEKSQFYKYFDEAHSAFEEKYGATYLDKAI